VSTSVIAPGGTVVIQQDAGTSVEQNIDLSAMAVPAWQANILIQPAEILRPTQPNQTGFWYQNTSAAAAQTGELEPTWPAVAGGTIQDGSVPWEAIVPPTGGDSIASVTWTQLEPPDAALTITEEVTGILTASALIGGMTQGLKYLVRVRFMMASAQSWDAFLSITAT
jgi:hypothetical protein